MSNFPGTDHKPMVDTTLEPQGKVIAFLLLNNFPQLPVAGMIDVLRDAEYVTGRKHYSWFTLSPQDEIVVAMNGTRTVTDHTFATAPPFDVLVICSGLDGHQNNDATLLRYLRTQALRRVTLVAVATGSWVLARAGLLNDRCATLHWEDIAAFEENFPLVEVRRTLFVQDGNILSCAGGTAAIDMFLKLIADDLGLDTASDVARQIMHHTVRPGSELLPIKENPFHGMTNVTVRKSVRLMHDNLESPLRLAKIAKRVNVSQKQLERLFRTHLNTTPQLHYRGIRLDHARALMRLSTLEVWEVAMLVGFASPQYLARCYKEKYGIPPSQDRIASGIESTQRFDLQALRDVE